MRSATNCKFTPTCHCLAAGASQGPSCNGALTPISLCTTSYSPSFSSTDALAKRGQLFGRRVLITGATGGVGDFAVQLARLAGAHVVASVRRADQVREDAASRGR